MNYFCEKVNRLQAYVPGEQPESLDVIKLNTNENPYPPSPRVLEALAKIQAERLRRYPNPTSGPFRVAAAKQFGVDPDMIICSNGMDELLRMLIQACCDQGRPVGFPVPTYTLFHTLADMIGAPIRSAPWGPDFSMPAEALSATDARLLLIVNPNSPTGTFVPVDDIAALAARVQGRAVVGVDEAYVDFANDNALRLVSRFDNVIVLRTLSKGYSLAGLRFGFAIAQKALIDGLGKVKDSYNLDAVAIALAAAAIADIAYARQTWRSVIEQRERLVQKLRQLGFAPLPSQANFVLATAPAPGAGEIYRRLKDRGILIRWWDTSGMTDKVRITIGTPQQNMSLVEALAAIVGARVTR